MSCGLRFEVQSGNIHALMHANMFGQSLKSYSTQKKIFVTQSACVLARFPQGLLCRPEEHDDRLWHCAKDLSKRGIFEALHMKYSTHPKPAMRELAKETEEEDPPYTQVTASASLSFSWIMGGLFSGMRCRASGLQFIDSHRS